MANYRHAKKGPSPIVIRILIIILCVLVVAAGAWAVYHFVLANPNKSNTTPSTKPEIPTWDVATKSEATTVAPTTENPDKEFEQLAEKYMSTMSETDKICQLFIVNPELLTGVDVVTEAGDMTKEALQKYPVGGIIYFDQNLESAEQTKSLISNSQSFAKTKMFIAVNEEGGDISPCAQKLNTTKLNNMFSYRKDGEKTAYNNAKTIATDIKQFGFNLDLAPVCDVLTNKDNTAIGERAYSDDFKEASTLIPQAVKGFTDSGIISTLKHFPGHGDTKEDSSETPAHVTKTKAELIKEELTPFKAGIDAGAEMVMVGHLVVDDIDPTCPATLSKKVVDDILRTGLKYDKIVITDSMQKGAITANYGTKDAVVRAINAGADMILMPSDLETAVDSVYKAIEDGVIKQSQLENSVKKILTLKYKCGILK